MRILVSGSTGLVGQAFSTAAEKAGHSIVRLARQNAVAAPRLLWDPLLAVAEPRLLEGFDAVVHLAGENIAGSRWSKSVKERIRQSRVTGTDILARALAERARPPRVFLSASAVGYYGNRGEERLTEDAIGGSGFLAEVCRDWESAAEPIRSKGVRTVSLRFGVVLSPEGGALAKMLTPFNLGLGGPMGNGRQWWSWVSLPDVVGAIFHAIKTESLSGPVNVTAPGALRNSDFTRILARALHRPALFPLPGFMARLAMGEMAKELLLAGARVEPQRLLNSGYRFQHPTLETALSAMGI